MTFLIEEPQISPELEHCDVCLSGGEKCARINAQIYPYREYFYIITIEHIAMNLCETCYYYIKYKNAHT